MRRATDRAERGNLAPRCNQERGVDEAILEAALDRHRLTGRDQIATLSAPAEIDQRTTGAVGHHELVAVLLGHGTADRDDPIRLERADRDRGGGRHRHAGARCRDGDGTSRSTDHQQTGGGERQTIAAQIEALAGRDVGMFGHLRRSSHWLTNQSLGARCRRPLNQAVQIPLRHRA
jgi:hypothetical protein